MEFLLCLLALVVVLRCKAQSSLPADEADYGALSPCDVPMRVHLAIRGKARGISIRSVHVSMDGLNTVRYDVAGSMPHGGLVSLVVFGDGSVVVSEGPDGYGEAPPDVRRRASHCLPSPQPDLERDAAWALGKAAGAR